MPIIKQLLPHEAHKIAAGEVVERPANIVKELIENALDASATQISIYIKDGGKELIRIVDNGTGMDEADALACFNKHATSKITHIDELETINTFGFRGEALASVAAVAHVTLITKMAHADVGIKVSVACNSITDTQPVATVTGTDIRVHDLFYTIPARKKFLKKSETEWRHIVQLFQAFCLAFPHIHFRLYHDDTEIHNCPPVTDSSQRFIQLWHHQSVLAFSDSRIDGTLNITGVISTHNQYRYDRSGLFFFVNNRWVKNNALASALLKGYQGLPDGRYPMACVHITVDSTLVDINIHPRKEEVAFMHPNKVTSLITNAVKSTLDTHTSTNLRGTQHAPPSASYVPASPVSTSPFKNTMPSVFTPFDFNTFVSAPDTQVQKIFDDQRVTLAEEQISVPRTASAPYETPSVDISSTTTQSFTQHTIHTPHTNSLANDEPVMGDAEQSFTLIGQLHKTYILVEHEEGLYLVDQHAAHERILYELFSQRFNDCATVNLLFPHIITLSANDYATIIPHLELFTRNGITLEPMGTHQLIVSATPIHLKEINFEELVRQVVGWITEYGNVDREDFFKTINEKLHAQCACKAAVKAGDALTHEQMQTLLTDLYKTKNRSTCPHGRPTGFLVSLDEIEKKVKRKK